MGHPLLMTRMSILYPASTSIALALPSWWGSPANAFLHWSSVASDMKSRGFPLRCSNSGGQAARDSWVHRISVDFLGPVLGAGSAGICISLKGVVVMKKAPKALSRSAILVCSARAARRAAVSSFSRAAVIASASALAESVGGGFVRLVRLAAADADAGAGAGAGGVAAFSKSQACKGSMQ